MYVAQATNSSNIATNIMHQYQLSDKQKDWNLHVMLNLKHNKGVSVASLTVQKQEKT